MMNIKGHNVSQLVSSGLEMAYSGTGVAAGLIGAKFVGDFIEGVVTTSPVVETSTAFQKITAWAGNNVPKLVTAYVLSKIETGSEPVNMVITGAMYGCVGSVVIDSYARAGNSGVPTMVLSGLENDHVKSLTAENTALKAAITKMGQRMGHDPSVAQVPSSASAESQQFITNAQPKRSVDQTFEFADQYMKRPIDQRFQFTGDVTSPKVMSSFGFMP